MSNGSTSGELLHLQPVRDLVDLVLAHVLQLECNYSVILHALRVDRVQGVRRLNLQNQIF